MGIPSRDKLQDHLESTDFFRDESLGIKSYSALGIRRILLLLS